VNERDQEGNPRRTTRREFCAQARGAVSLAALASLLESCGGGSPTASSSASSLPSINGSVANGVVSVTVDASSPLATIGNKALVVSSAGNYLVARPAQASFMALSAICTHQVCTISGYDSQGFVCPCHGSRFSTSGSVLNGPATVALRQYSTAFNNDVLTITP
jgi:cytochrome b6-f complex iron-sulfur subunit